MWGRSTRRGTPASTGYTWCTIKAHHRPHGLRGAALELRVARLPARAYLKAPLHRRDRRALTKLVPLGQDWYLVGPHDALSGGDHVQPVLHCLVGLIGSADAVLF